MVTFNGILPFVVILGLFSKACMSMQMVSKINTFYYSLLLFNLCTALGGYPLSFILSCKGGVLLVFFVFFQAHGLSER